MTFADDELDDSTYSLSSTAMLELGGYTNQQLAALASSAGGLNLQSSLPAAFRRWDAAGGRLA